MSTRDKVKDQMEQWFIKPSSSKAQDRTEVLSINEDKLLKDLSKHNDEWLRIARMYLSREDSKDVIQDMYLIVLHRHSNFSRFYIYPSTDDINFRYLYTIIKNLCLDFLKSKKAIKVNIDDVHLTAPEPSDENDAMELLFTKVVDIVNTWSPYEQNLFTHYMFSGLSLRDLSHGTDKVDKVKSIDAIYLLTESAIKNGTGISVNSIWTTISGLKDRLREEMSECFEDYFNGDFEYINR